MKHGIVIGLGAAALLAVPALAADSSATVKTPHRHHVALHHHKVAATSAIPQTATAQVAPPATSGAPSFFPHIAPYPNGQGDEDGLSRSADDCNKGCIDH